MTSKEKIKCGKTTICGHSTICGTKLNAADQDLLFQMANVGLLNSGWIEIEPTATGAKYLYVNVENVSSDTLNITRIDNNIIAEIPNIYGVKLALNYETGDLSLLGRNVNEQSVLLSTVNFPMGIAITNILWSTENHTITFKAKNHSDIVIDLYEVLEMSNYYNKEELDEMFEALENKLDAFIEESTIKAEVNLTDRSPIKTLVDKTDIAYGFIQNATFTIPSNIVHGYTSAISFKTETIINVDFLYSGSFTKKFIMNGGFIDESGMVYNANSQYEILIICDGVDVKIYVQELSI